MAYSSLHAAQECGKQHSTHVTQLGDAAQLQPRVIASLQAAVQTFRQASPEHEVLLLHLLGFPCTCQANEHCSCLFLSDLAAMPHAAGYRCCQQPSSLPYVTCIDLVIQPCRFAWWHISMMLLLPTQPITSCSLSAQKLAGLTFV